MDPSGNDVPQKGEILACGKGPSRKRTLSKKADRLSRANVRPIGSTTPFPHYLIKAVAGCTRVLSDLPDADRLLDRSDAATIGGLRAFGDRLALRRRFHDPAIHRL